MAQLSTCEGARLRVLPSHQGSTLRKYAKPSEVESNPRGAMTFVTVVDDHRVSADVVDVALRTKNQRVSVGMTGILLGLPGATVEITKVFAGGAKARISAPGIDKEIKHHRLAVLGPGGIADGNAAGGHFPHGRDSKSYQEALARIKAKNLTAD